MLRNATRIVASHFRYQSSLIVARQFPQNPQKNLRTSGSSRWVTHLWRVTGIAPIARPGIRFWKARHDRCDYFRAARGTGKEGQLAGNGTRISEVRASFPALTMRKSYMPSVQKKMTRGGARKGTTPSRRTICGM